MVTAATCLGSKGLRDGRLVKKLKTGEEPNIERTRCRAERRGTHDHEKLGEAEVSKA
jgi:hypothetical protein